VKTLTNQVIQTPTCVISKNSPTYFIADIAANHDGSLDRAINLIRLAAESGANAAKFQNFKAETIVSNRGFAELGGKLAHQSKWKKDVVQVYREASIPLDWTDSLIEACKENNIDYFTAPYDLEYIDYFAKKMSITKIGSGDITWLDSLRAISNSKTYVFLATGASSMDDVKRALEVLQSALKPIVLMQCNTNYTGDPKNVEHLNLKVLETYSREFPDVITGLSDHTPGHLSVLAAVTLGARVVEKHFTDDTSREGPDHGFSLDPKTWSAMVKETRLLERALGDGVKRIEANEVDSAIVQRRALRYGRDLKKGNKIERGDLIALRPCPANGLSPFEIDLLVGKFLKRDVSQDELTQLDDFE
jgi:N-acetylneuraminate synthase